MSVTNAHAGTNETEQGEPDAPDHGFAEPRFGNPLRTREPARSDSARLPGHARTIHSAAPPATIKPARGVGIMTLLIGFRRKPSPVKARRDRSPRSWRNSSSWASPSRSRRRRRGGQLLDDDYRAAGAEVLPRSAELLGRADIVFKGAPAHAG